MLTEGKSEGSIMDALKNRGVDRNFSKGDMEKLKKKGVNRSVISAMVLTANSSDGDCIFNLETRAMGTARVLLTWENENLPFPISHAHVFRSPFGYDWKEIGVTKNQYTSSSVYAHMSAHADGLTFFSDIDVDRDPDTTNFYRVRGCKKGPDPLTTDVNGVKLNYCGDEMTDYSSVVSGSPADAVVDAGKSFSMAI